MPAKQKICSICAKPFDPDPGAGARQKTCSKAACQRERKNRWWRRYMSKNPESLVRHKEQTRLWARAGGYWKEFRQRPENAAYREREIQRMRRKRKSLRRVAKQDQIKTLYVERLRRVQALTAGAKSVAKQDQIARGLSEVAGCLIWKETVAKQCRMDLAGSGAG